MKNILPLQGGNLVYKIVGKDDADTIFFCHSLGANQSLWDRQIEQLSDTYRIVSCDLRGHGESDIFSTHTPLKYWQRTYLPCSTILIFPPAISLGYPLEA